VALCQARSSTKPLWGFTSRNPYHSQSRAEQLESKEYCDGISISQNFTVTE
jgi:hypothetical protein